MKYPKRVQITKHVFYIILWVDFFPDNATHNTKGICNPEDKTIIIKNGMSTRVTWETFIHEMMHAMEFEYKIEISHQLLDKIAKASGKMLKLNKKRIRL